MNAIGFPEVLVIVFIVLLYGIPIIAAVWAIMMLQRLHAGQQALQAKIDAIERALQQR